ncbi:MAG TPA: YraN family protein [Holophagaceae bacterium]|nr:YraN family protein [Holophagaceae bacterium]
MASAISDSRRRGEAARRYGRWMERLTFWLLWLRGFEAVAWREKVGRLELDLILARGRELRVLEVKARARGAWVGGDLALGPEQRLRLQRALRSWLDRRPWPGEITFQRVSWSGLRCRFHPPERWEGLGIPREGTSRA